jgi:hypothetical protein
MMIMKIKNLFPVALLSLCVCGAPYSNDDILYLLSIPRASDLEVSFESNQRSQGLRTVADACPAEPATTYLKMRTAAQDLNTSLLAILGIVDLITQYPPTEREENFRRWGPWTDKGVSYQVEVRRTVTDGDVQFSYEMNGKLPNEEAWRVLLSGQLLEGATSSDGRGNMSLDFDQMRVVNPSTTDQGQFDVDYDTRGDGLSLGLSIRSSSIALSSTTTSQIRMSHFEKADVLARYAYEESENGMGSFRIEGAFDVHEDDAEILPKEEFMTVFARWIEDQRGRAETTIEGGEISGIVRVSECWDSDFILNYREGQFNRLTATCGNAANCPAEYQESGFLR